MTTLERLRSANPVPEPDRLLSEPGELDAFLRTVGQASPSPVDEPLAGRADGRRQGWLIVAAAATVVIVGGTLLALLRAPADPQPAGPTGAEQVAYIEQAYAALNDGDVQGWMRRFAEDASFSGRTADSERLVNEILAAANRRLTIVEPCATAAPNIVVCTVTDTDDFHAAGGLSITRVETFTLTDEGRIGDQAISVLSLTEPGYYTYTQAFNEWLRDAHPDVWDQIRPGLITHLPATPDKVRIAVRYVDEFIAQSERFPVGDE